MSTADSPLPTPLPAMLASLRARLTRVLPAQVTDAVGRLTDEQIWWRPNESSNSAGNLVLHLSGSLNHYLNYRIGGLPYERHRELEFAERRQIPRAELLAIFEEMVAKAVTTFESITEERLSEPSSEPKMSAILAEDLLNIVTHVSTHVGQILWITKMLTGGGLDEAWMRAHREGGGWRRPDA